MIINSFTLQKVNRNQQGSEKQQEQLESENQKRW